MYEEGQTKLNFFGKIFQKLLILINTVFFILGLVVIITAALLKWTGVFNKFLNIPGIESLVGLGSITHVSTALFAIGGFVLLLSLFGLCGTCRLSKFFLKVYMAIVLCLFLAMLGCLLVLVFTSGCICREREREKKKKRR
jgi:hypothetical protein